MLGDRQPQTGQKGVLAGLALTITWNPGTSKQKEALFEFRDVTEFWARWNAEKKKEAIDPLLKGRILKALTRIRVEDGSLKEYNSVWLDHKIRIGDPYVQVFCRNDSALMSQINGDCGHAWWPTFGKPITNFFTCNRCEPGIDFDDVAVSMRGRDVHGGTTIEDMPPDDERY